MNLNRRVAGLSAWALLMTALPDASDAASRDLEGTWAGDQLRMVVQQGKAEIEAGCAVASIGDALQLDARGQFIARGTWQEQRGGPEPEGAARPAGARFEGRLKGDLLTLMVQPDAGGAPQVFQLRRGAVIKILRCLGR